MWSGSSRPSAQRPSGPTSPSSSRTTPSSRWSALRRRAMPPRWGRGPPTRPPHHPHTIPQILRAEPHRLSQQEIADATSSRLSFGPDDATFIDTDVSLLFDPEGEDVRAVIEFANTQLLEMRYLDQQLDDALERAYGLLSKRRWSALRVPSLYGSDLRELAQLQLDAAILFEQVTNALKLIGEQYLTRVYGLASRRFHLAEWDVSITRKLQTVD